MSDDLVISGAGSIVVATDELLAHAEALDRLTAVIHGARAELSMLAERLDADRLRSVDSQLGALHSAEQIQAAHQIQVALAALSRADHASDTVARGLAFALVGYGAVEQFGQLLAKALFAQIGYTVGALSPLLISMALPGVTATAAAVLGAWLATGKSPAEWIRANNEILTNPTTVALLRGAVMSADDFAGGALRMPPELVAALGDEGVGLAGLNTSAALAILLGRGGGLLAETGVSVERLSTRTTAAPAQTISDRALRILDPEREARGEQVRIDRYTVPGQPDRFEVYISGTVDFSIGDGSEPWDMTSNVNGIAGLPPASYRAVVDAMRASGVTSDSPVVLSGYSQGGLVGSLIAASGSFNVQGLVTFGAPAGQIEVPASIPVLSIRHTDDLVPALGGYDVNGHALVVERQLFAGRDIPAEFAIPAHQLDYYRETATLVDAADSAKVRIRLSALSSFGANATSVETTTWHATRIVGP